MGMDEEAILEELTKNYHKGPNAPDIGTFDPSKMNIDPSIMQNFEQMMNKV